MKYKYNVCSLSEVDSTNDYIKRELASGGRPRFPFVVTAESQAAGRGRLNRGFYSPKGGLYFSAAFLSSQIKCPIDLLTVGVGTAVAVSTEAHCGGRVEVKWVNDVIFRGKKVCGILCESTYSEFDGETVYIVGIGVNTSADAIYGFMPEKVGAIKVDCTNSELMQDILYRIGGIFGSASTEFLAAYNERLGIRGKTIDILVRGEKTRATVIGAELEGLKCLIKPSNYVFVKTYNEILTDLYEV